MAPSPSDLVAADALLKNNGAAYLRVGTLVVAAYEYVFHLTDFFSHVSSTELPN